jgi:nucleoside-diphosphate-sugar epimerase
MNQAERDMLLELSEPDEQVIQTVARLQGDLLLLGAAGKVGHALALMAKRSLDKVGGKRRVIAVSRFSTPGVQQQFEADGITTISADVGDPEQVEKLPDASDVIYLVGQKFGTAAGNQATTWLLNAYVPGVVARRWKSSRIAAYSSGNVYKFMPVTTDGPREDGEVSPIGEYAWSVLGRERVFEAFSRTYGTKVVTVRLNYANEPRYGVLVDIGRQVAEGKTIDVTQGYANVVWAADANRVTMKCLDLASSPPTILNLAGPKIAVRDAAQRFAKVLGTTARFTGQESPNALLNDGSFCWQRFGPPQVSVDQMIERIAVWLKQGHSTWNKPTHFEVRDGKF